MTDERTRSLAAELSPEEQRELGDLTGVGRSLAGYVAPEPSAAETARLLAHLRPLVAARAAVGGSVEAEEHLPEPPPDEGALHWLRLTWSQTTVLEPAFWWASSLLLGLGLLLGVLDRQGILASLFALSSPVLAAGAVAYAFRPATRSLWELERTAPVQPLELIYSRLGLVVGLNLVVVLGALGVVWLQEPRMVLWRLVIAWLGPLLGLAGIALYTTVRWGAIAGAGVPLLLWAGLLLGGLEWLSRRTGETVQELLQRLLPSLSASDLSLALSAAALLLGLALIRQAGRLAMEQGAWN
ncbi:MAG: hypothetical protein ACOY93_03245 [Bacillota bacterium]